jgi:hypothetical protein
LASTDTLYSCRFITPERVERGRDNLLKCPVYRDAALVAPASGTVSIWDAAGTAIVSAAAVTVASSVATYTLANATTTALALAEGWRFEWSLTFASPAETHVFRTDGALVRRRLYPVVTDADLVRLHSDLLASSTDAIVPTGWDAQDYLDEAWAEIDAKLVAAGNYPNLVMSPSALRAAHMYMTLAAIFRDLSTSAHEGKYATLAEHYDARATDAWSRLTFRYDSDDDGNADAANKRKAATATVWLSGGRR